MLGLFCKLIFKFNLCLFNFIGDIMSKEKTIKQKCKLVWDQLPKGDIYWFSGAYNISFYLVKARCHSTHGDYSTKKAAKYSLYCQNIENFLREYCNEYDIEYDIDFNIDYYIENNNLKHYDFLEYIVKRLILN